MPFSRDKNSQRCSGQRVQERIECLDGISAGFPQSHRKRVFPRVRGSERVARRQRGCGVGAGEVLRPQVTGRDVP
jgi:hypothetical protein